MRWPRSHFAEGLARGRLLGYSPDDNLADGAAAVETQGFLDSNNVPPWDTWVGYIYESERCNYLVAWIPPELVDVVSRGILVNPEECIWWLDERDTEFAKLLRQREIL